MNSKDLARLQDVLAEAESIIQESLAQKKTIQDMNLHKAALTLRERVYKRQAKLKPTRRS